MLINILPTRCLSMTAYRERDEGTRPSLPEEKQLKVWHEKHPLKKARTEKQQEVLNEALKRGQSVKVIA